MKVVMRRGANIGAPFYERLAAWTISMRLCTKWPHGGIVVGDTLYHATARHGLTSEPYINTGNWDEWDFGPEEDQRVIAQFNARLAGAKGKVRYDWFSLLAFTPAVWISRLFGSEIRYNSWLYCYEWQYEALEQKNVKVEVTPENILEICLRRLKK